MHAGEFWREFLLVEAVYVPSFESILSVFGPVRLLHVEHCQTRNLLRGNDCLHLGHEKRAEG